MVGELGWQPNFNIKKSKNNDDRHPNYKEFFDAPKDYNVEFQNAIQVEPSLKYRPGDDATSM
jgi:hypothetical protein